MSSIKDLDFNSLLYLRKYDSENLNSIVIESIDWINKNIETNEALKFYSKLRSTIISDIIGTCDLLIENNNSEKIKLLKSLQKNFVEQFKRYFQNKKFSIIEFPNGKNEWQRKRIKHLVLSEYIKDMIIFINNDRESKLTKKKIQNDECFELILNKMKDYFDSENLIRFKNYLYAENIPSEIYSQSSKSDLALLFYNLDSLNVLPKERLKKTKFYYYSKRYKSFKEIGKITQIVSKINNYTNTGNKASSYMNDLTNEIKNIIA